MRARLLLLTCLAAAQAMAPAHAQSAGSSLGNHDSNAPVNVDADRLEVQDRADRAVFAGHVRATQADLTLSAPRVTVAYSKAAPTPAAGTSPRTGGAGGTGDMGVQINRLDATGGVVVQSPTETATGSVAIYDLNRRLITMLGNVSLVRQGNRVTGGRLVWDLNSGRATVDGSAVGSAAGGVSTGQGGRVSGRFTVPQASN